MQPKVGILGGRNGVTQRVGLPQSNSIRTREGIRHSEEGHRALEWRGGASETKNH